MIFGWIISLFFNLFYVYEAQDVCNVILNIHVNKSPLFPSYASRKLSQDPVIKTNLKPFFEYPSIVNTDTKSLTILGTGSQIIACPGTKNHILNDKKNIGDATCTNRRLSIDGQQAKSNTIGCNKQPSATIFHTQTTCHGDREGVFHIIGWLIEPKWFIPQITVCWDPVKETTIYTRHVIYGSALKKRLLSPGRPTFKVGKLFSHRITQLYSKTSQLEKLRELLGAVRSIPGTGTFFFARGHLAPDADFILPAEQDATYYYSNVIPQFQSLNNGNWKSVEYNVRELAEERNSSFIVYSGTMGTLQLKNKNGQRVPIYLHPKGKQYPVPLVIWKVIHDPVRKEAVALLGLNFVQKDNEVFRSFFNLCDDVCKTLKWSGWESTEYKRGSILCCTWNQFKLLVPQMLDLKDVKLLNN